MLFTPILILLLSNSIQCSLVLDAVNQHGIYVSDYCPKMQYCAEGAHVMCMYYNPNRVMGPRCRNARNVTVTPELANNMLDISNAVRSKIARGEEKGKNGKPLPRGYGIFKLKWDSELATFAQVLANQCVLRHDMCRATKKFPAPGQTAGLVRFSIPDWLPVSKSRNFTRKGLDDEKLLYATTQTLKSWYGQKSYVTAQMLANYPDWSKDPNKQNGRLYLEMIYGPATHMGCGISAYTEYAYYNNDVPLNYNSIQVICNYSARPRIGTAVFNTVPPSDNNSPFNSCGCPSGSIEDDDCLCIETERDSEKPEQQFEKSDKCTKGVNCDPTVVLLPIFTVEDAPPEMLITREKLANKSVGRAEEPTEIIDSFEELFYNNMPENKRKFQKSQKYMAIRPNANGQKRRLATHTNKNMTIRVRHFSKQTIEQNHHGELQHEDMHSRKQMQSHMKTSLFAKAPRFELPGSPNFMTSTKKDVVPRKDFSEAKKLAIQYLYDKNNIMIPTKFSKFSSTLNHIFPDLNSIKSLETVSLNNELNTYLHPKLHRKNRTHIEDVHFHDILTTETVLNTAEQRIINEKKYLSDPYPFHDINKADAKTVPIDSDKKLMALLDTLEQEVKHIELRENEKQIFDAKIKKIYGTVVGKSSNVLTNTDKLIVLLNMTEKETGQHENKQRFAKQFNKKYINTHENNFPPKVETRPNELENENNFVELPNTQSGRDDKIDVDEILPTANDQKLQHYLTKNTSIKDSNDIATENFDKKSFLIDKNMQMEYDRKNILTKNDDVTDDFVKKSTSKRREVAYSRRDRPNVRNMNNVRQMNHNHINSFEHVQYRYNNRYNGRKTYRDEDFDRGVIRNNGKPKHRSSSLDYRPRSKNYYSNDAYEDPLSVERRKYYQAKLDSMERKLKETRRNSRRKDIGRPHMRTLRNNIGSDDQMNSIYTSSRARFLHGY